MREHYDFTSLKHVSFNWQLVRFPAPGANTRDNMVLASGSGPGPNVAPHGAGKFQLKLPADFAARAAGAHHGSGQQQYCRRACQHRQHAR